MEISTTYLSPDLLETSNEQLASPTIDRAVEMLGRVAALTQYQDEIRDLRTSASASDRVTDHRAEESRQLVSREVTCQDRVGNTMVAG